MLNIKNKLLNLHERAAEDEKAANVVAFVVSDSASYITGNVIVAGGGYPAKWSQQSVPLRRLFTLS